MRKTLYTRATNTISKFNRTPLYLILFVSDECPNNCSHCWYTKDWKSQHIKSSVLTFDELKKIAHSVKSFRFLSITGGEAFLRDDIVEIVDMFNQTTKVQRLDIPTSGFNPELISQKAERILINTPHTPFRIDVSLDGLEETHNKIRKNRNAFEHAVATIKELNKLRTFYSNLDLSVITTISDGNYHEIDEFDDYISKILPQGEWMVNLVRGNQPHFDVSGNVLNSYQRAHEIIENRKKSNQFVGDRHKYGKLLTAKNSLRRKLISEIAINNRKGCGCAAGSLAGVLFNDGELRPCETLDSSFGNIRDFDYNLYEAWNSPKAKLIRKEIQYSECICTHECFLSVSILLQPSCWFGLLKERLKV